MKLLTKISRSYALATGIALMGGLVLFYFALLWLVQLETDEKLVNSVDEISSEIAESNYLPSFPPFIEVSETTPVREMEVFKDTSIFDKVENEYEPYRTLTSVKAINGRYYKITVRSSEIEKTEFLTLSFIILAVIFSAFLIGLSLLFRRQNARLWKPFFKNLDQVNVFSISGSEGLKLENSGIDEFDAMNEVVEKLTRKAVVDYQNLKQFTENASHELQSPLAVIKGKVESLINDTELDEDQVKKVSSISMALTRLEKLNRSLLLLSRIENNQFQEKNMVSFSQLTDQQVGQFEELISLKGLTLNSDIRQDFTRLMNPELASVLISNLLTNAIRYTPEGGHIGIIIGPGTIIVENSGISELQKKERLFERFVKEDASVSSPGLGLSIVKTICDMNDLAVEYRWNSESRMHVFMIRAVEIRG